MERVCLMSFAFLEPFDRMLIAQAQAEGLVIVTRDPQIKTYGIRTLEAES